MKNHTKIRNLGQNRLDFLKFSGLGAKSDPDLRPIFLHTDLQNQPIYLIPSLQRRFVLYGKKKAEGPKKRRKNLQVELLSFFSTFLAF